MGYIINVIGCDGISEDDMHSEDMLEYIKCANCLNVYNDNECIEYRHNMQLILIFG